MRTTESTPDTSEAIRRGFIPRGVGLRLLDNSTLLLGIASIIVIVVFAVLLRDTGFLTATNLVNVGRQIAPVAVMAVATVLVLSAGELDLSFGPVIALSGLVAATVMQSQPWPIAVAAALGVGAAVGLVNGTLTVGLRIPSFIATLGTLGALAGFAQQITDLQSVPVTNQGFARFFGTGSLLGVSVLIAWLVLAVVVGELVVRRTVFGRRLLASGGNETAAQYSGVATGRIKFAAMMISAMAAAFVGLLYIARLGGARYTLGDQDLLAVLAAVIIGGTALTGGRANVSGAVVGAFLVGIINNGLILLGLSTAEQRIFGGVVIVLAVALTGVRDLMKRRART